MSKSDKSTRTRKKGPRIVVDAHISLENISKSNNFGIAIARNPSEIDNISCGN